MCVCELVKLRAHACARLVGGVYSDVVYSVQKIIKKIALCMDFS